MTNQQLAEETAREILQGLTKGFLLNRGPKELQESITALLLAAFNRLEGANRGLLQEAFQLIDDRIQGDPGDEQGTAKEWRAHDREVAKYEKRVDALKAKAAIAAGGGET